MQKKTEIKRKTKETSIVLVLKLDGMGSTDVSFLPKDHRLSNMMNETGLGFFNHMLDLLAFHSGISLIIAAKGDTHVDDHHLVEDIGISLGEALRKAVDSGAGIARYGSALIPMDEALVMCVIDIGGKSHLSYSLDHARRIKGFETELIREFFEAMARSAKMNIHLRQLAGRNSHHIIEAAFKAFARALKQALERTGRLSVMSTKGVL